MLDVNATEVVSIDSTDLFISPSNLGFKMQANEQGTFVLKPTCGGGGSTCKYSPSLEVTVSGSSRSVQAESLRKQPRLFLLMLTLVSVLFVIFDLCV
jgi:hypothetical protein